MPLSETEIAIDASAGRWFVAWTTRSCAERAFVDEMLTRGYAAYCPMTARYSNGKPVLEPAFKGYAFVAVPGEPESPEYADAIYEVRGSKRLAKRTLIPIPHQRRFLMEINQVRKALEAEPELLATRQFVPGRWVRVTRGKWMGQTARIDQVKKGVIVVWCEQVLGGVELPVGMDEVEFLD